MRFVSHSARLAALTFAAAAASGCAVLGRPVGPDYVAPTIESPSGWLSHAPLGIAPSGWDVLGDPLLQDLVLQASAENRSLAAATADVERARSEWEDGAVRSRLADREVQRRGLGYRAAGRVTGGEAVRCRGGDGQGDRDGDCVVGHAASTGDRDAHRRGVEVRVPDTAALVGQPAGCYRHQTRGDGRVGSSADLGDHGGAEAGGDQDGTDQFGDERTARAANGHVP